MVFVRNAHSNCSSMLGLKKNKNSGHILYLCILVYFGAFRMETIDISEILILACYYRDGN